MCCDITLFATFVFYSREKTILMKPLWSILNISLVDSDEKYSLLLLLQSEFTIRLFWIFFSLSCVSSFKTKGNFLFLARHSKLVEVLADGRSFSLKFYDEISVCIKLFVTLILTSKMPWADPPFPPPQRIQHIELYTVTF